MFWLMGNLRGGQCGSSEYGGKSVSLRVWGGRFLVNFHVQEGRNFMGVGRGECEQVRIGGRGGEGPPIGVHL